MKRFKAVDFTLNPNMRKQIDQEVNILKQIEHHENLVKFFELPVVNLWKSVSSDTFFI
jgi:serine/threonine protein kinase